MEQVTFPSDNQIIDAYLLAAESNKGILLFHDIFGYQLPETRNIAEFLRTEGYTVLLPDLYRGNPWRPDSDWSNHETWRQEHSLQRVMKDVITANRYLRTQVEKVASIGFCWGGDITFKFAQTMECDAAVICYGTRMNSNDTVNLKCPTLAIFGGSDHVISDQQIHQFGVSLAQSTAVECKLRIYPEAGHAFIHRPPPGAQDLADKALQEMIQWLSKHL